ncbi:LPS assembly lipoprotein LptE [Vulgatibacter incomptus]|uniref:Putative lipoprotein n=1 Tax=Vulgatibacter incomptus TaxID=1391653 RepID=A0A0K1PAZ8_9BACT|nr:LptE family protein [Vulgatibacter incomptus]AKU90591.1 putative lipoprotein [Vulgatibacter incomptus]
MTLRVTQPAGRRDLPGLARAGRDIGARALAAARPLMKALPLALAIGGCGYQFAVGGPGFPDDIRAVYVPVFANRTSEPEAGAIFSEALAETLARAGRTAGPAAPARVDGEIVSMIAAPAATTRDGTGVGIYRLSAVVRLSLVRDGAELCRRELAGSEDYLPATNLQALEASRREAVRRLAATMMASAGRELCPNLAPR